MASLIGCIYAQRVCEFEQFSVMATTSFYPTNAKLFSLFLSGNATFLFSIGKKSTKWWILVQMRAGILQDNCLSSRIKASIR